MLARLIRNDLRRNRVIAAALFIFILLASWLAASGAATIQQLLRAIDNLFVQAAAPHYVQLHAGEMDDEAVHQFAASHSAVRAHQISPMLVVDNRHIYYGERTAADTDSVMDNGFVTQNGRFDYLLNLDNERVRVEDGQIAVPVYYMQREGLAVGDRIRIATAEQERSFEIVDFVRDIQMNPSIVSSKRFVVSDADWQALHRMTGEIEYIVSFLLHDPGMTGAFASDYRQAGLPSAGPSVDYALFRMLNALTDGAVAAAILLASLLLTAIAMLCLRFTILTAMEEDRREIGILKAIGVRTRYVNRMYGAKYLAIAALAAAGGFIVSLPTNRLFASNIALYIGAVPATLATVALAAAASAVTALMVGLFTRLILRRIGRITAVDALRAGALGAGDGAGASSLPLRTNGWMNVHLWLALKNVIARPGIHTMLLLIYGLCACLMLIPANFLNTLQSPGFVSYMGVGQSDVRIDFQQSPDADAGFADALRRLEQDPDVRQFAGFVTYRYNTKGPDGATESLYVEIGDFAAFPLQYGEGVAPMQPGEVALSRLNAESLEIKVGDELVVQELAAPLKVTGIYQDITNGGRTAKAVLPDEPATEEGGVRSAAADPLWRTIAVDFHSGVAPHVKMAQYAAALPGAKVIDLEGYLSQTLGSTIDQIRKVAVLAAVMALFIAWLVTSLFIRLMLAKDSGDIAIKRGLGFSLADTRTQYTIQTLAILAAGIATGALAANLFGPGIAGLFMSAMGAGRIDFAVNPAIAYILYPLALALAAAAAVLVGVHALRQKNFADTIFH